MLEYGIELDGFTPLQIHTLSLIWGVITTQLKLVRSRVKVSDREFNLALQDLIDRVY
ncbi:MAG: hypothetical protein QI199_02105 [Candidatus Korarchaeota archaeon]|nr:hypothetical protein [Candidatus Korarchaeota archaeon]